MLLQLSLVRPQTGCSPNQDELAHWWLCGVVPHADAAAAAVVVVIMNDLLRRFAGYCELEFLPRRIYEKSPGERDARTHLFC